MKKCLYILMNSTGAQVDWCAEEHRARHRRCRFGNSGAGICEGSDVLCGVITPPVAYETYNNQNYSSDGARYALKVYDWCGHYLRLLASMHVTSRIDDTFMSGIQEWEEQKQIIGTYWHTQGQSAYSGKKVRQQKMYNKDNVRSRIVRNWYDSYHTRDECFRERQKFGHGENPLGSSAIMSGICQWKCTITLLVCIYRKDKSQTDESRYE